MSCTLILFKLSLDLITTSVDPQSLTHKDFCSGNEQGEAQQDSTDDILWAEIDDQEPWLCSPQGRSKRSLQSRYPVYRTDPAFVYRLPSGSMFVPYLLMLRGGDAVPRQLDNWSCGANSAARFAAMLRNEVEDYETFKEKEPTYGGFLGIPKIGANPEKLQDFIRERTTLKNYSVAQRCSRRFAPQFDILVKSLQLGRPALVLFMFNGRSMHWVNVVARDSQTTNWFIMDTNGAVYEITGGDDELKHRMNMDNCAAQKFNFVERFNSVTTTECAAGATVIGANSENQCQEGPRTQ